MNRLVVFGMVFSSFILSNQTSAVAQDQTAIAAPCTASEFRDLDIWLGDWDLSWSLPEGKTGYGRNIILRISHGQ